MTIGDKPKRATKRKASQDNATSAGSSEKTFQNSIESDLNINFEIDGAYNTKIVTWNVSGVRSCVKKGCAEYLEREDADIICLNELKVGTEKEIPDEIKMDGYHAYWNVSKGSPGVGILSKVKPIKVTNDLPEKFNEEKRLITAEYSNFFLVCCYVVNAGRGLKTLDKRMEWNEVFDTYIRKLDKKKPVIVAGDLNVAHTEIDLANPKTNQRSAGFTKEEREGFSKLLSYGFVDTFREKYPEKEGAYTFWSYMNK
jgi:AP endonuclease-1